MKSVLKLAVCGFVAIALHTTQANAQAAQAISGDAMAVMQKNAIARQFLEQKLGVKSGSVVDANAALSKLSQADKIAVMKAINSYTNKAVTGNTPSAVSNNEAAARAAFQSSEAVQVAAIAQGAASKDAVAPGVGKTSKVITCSQKLDVSQLVVAGGPNITTLEEAQKKGVMARGACNENPEEMANVENKKIFGLTVECMLNNGVTASTSDAERAAIGGTCLEAANGGKMAKGEGAAAIAGINSKCGWFAQKYAAQAIQ
jgi:hypothetical protein